MAEREREEQEARHNLMSALKVGMRKMLDNAIKMNEENTQVIKKEHEKRKLKRRIQTFNRFMDAINRQQKIREERSSHDQQSSKLGHGLKTDDSINSPKYNTHLRAANFMPQEQRMPPTLNPVHQSTKSLTHRSQNLKIDIPQSSKR